MFSKKKHEGRNCCRNSCNRLDGFCPNTISLSWFLSILRLQNILKIYNVILVLWQQKLIQKFIYTGGSSRRNYLSILITMKISICQIVQMKLFFPNSILSGCSKKFTAGHLIN